MRIPETWHDKGLLEDEPFLSTFTARQLSGPPTRQCTSKDNDDSRNAAIAKQIKGKKKLKVVQAWLDLAFKPHGRDLRCRQVKVDDPGIIKFFVHFYWTLSQDTELALRDLEKERKRRGYVYVLDIPAQRGASSASTADSTRLKKAHTKQKRIPQPGNNVIDETTNARPPQHEDISDKSDHVSNGALRGQSLPKEVKAYSIPVGLNFKEDPNAKNNNVPRSWEREEYLSQSCPPSLDPTPGLSEAQNLCQNELGSSTLPSPPDPQNTPAVYEPLKISKKRQASPDTRPVKHRKSNGTASDTSKLCNVSNASITTQLANTLTKPDNQITNFGVGDNLEPRSQASNHLEPSCPPLMSATSRSEFNKTALSLPTNPLVPNTYDPQGGNEARPAQGKQRSRPILGAATKKTPVPPPRPREVNTELRHVSNFAVSGRSLGKRTKNFRNEVDISLKRSKLLLQDCPSSVGPRFEPVVRNGSSKVDINASAFPSRPNLSVIPASHNLVNREKRAAASRDPQPAKGRQGPQQINGVVADKVIDINKEFCNDPDRTKRPRRLAGLHFKKVPLPGPVQQTPQGCAPRSDSKTDDSPEGQGTSVPQIHGYLLQSSSDQSLAVCNWSNPRKRRSSILDALERENIAVAPKEVSVGKAEQAMTTSHRKTRKRRKVVQEETVSEPVKDETIVVTAHKQSRKKRTRTKKQGLVEVESPDKSIIRSETYPATDLLPPISKTLSHQPKEDETTSNVKREHASSLEDGQHKRLEVAVDQEGSVPITVQPEVKKRRGRPPKVKTLEQEASAPIPVQHAPGKRKKSRPPKSEMPSSAQAQLNAETTIPLSGQNVEANQELSISTFIPLYPAYRHDVFGAQETVEELPRPSLDRNMKDELINASENWLLAQEDGLVEEDFALDCVAPAAMEGHPTDIFPTQKPLLDIKPPIWAQSRQEVCETFDWFRSYQGGVYFAHNMVKGYLLSAFSSKRDRFEHGGRLIISHGGGKAESLHTRKGQTRAQPASDQLAQDKSVRALLDNYRNQRPLVLLIDDKYVLFPYDLGARDITYVVLGFYTIAHAWAEYQPANNESGRVVRYKFAFRWCDDQGSPWWITDKETHLSDLTQPSTPTTSSFEPASKRTPRKKGKNDQGAVLCTTKVREAASSEPKSFPCKSCHMSSPQVYTRSWACLHPNCSMFWRDINGDFLPDNLEYDFGFLELTMSLPIPPDFGKLKPNLPSCLSTNGTVTNYAFTRGFHCNSCGRLSCRFKWEKWECANCGYYLEVAGPVHKAKDFWSNSLPIGYKDHFINKISKIEQQPIRGFRHEKGMGNIQSFILPCGRGTIHHIQPGTPLGRLEADDIFIEYQQQATAGVLNFRRWPLRSHKCRGALLTNYFSQNSGEPYQYVGGAANTVPFENAPGAVVKARALIQKRIQQALETHVEFNEVLSAAYMERQKMAFHSDNEIGLGPVVAGLSLGSPALMHFRIHAKHDLLREQKGNLLSFVLRHGDVLVMDGAGVQEYYEHTVIPNNFRIAATARQINPEHS
ncbi:hypothetical protein BYT27DRAFT_7334882 [Phlegmacium glaucopus]|nr:hypothetical protein BYT27DRAFT_7334882 [Phlegmacium glaucopus]